MNMFILVFPSVIAILSLVIAFLAYQRTTELRRSSIYTELSQQANAINDAFLKTKIPTPYMRLLNIEQEDKEFVAVSVIFFHHFQLLNMVFRNRTTTNFLEMLPPNPMSIGLPGFLNHG